MAAPAAAGTVLEYEHGPLIPRDEPYLAPPEGPEAAVQGAQQPCGLPAGGPAGSRITFPGSKLVYQYYVGGGIQLQPLANFGMANGMATACMSPTRRHCDLPGLKQLIDDLVAVRSQRGGFTTW